MPIKLEFLLANQKLYAWDKKYTCLWKYYTDFLCPQNRSYFLDIWAASFLCAQFQRLFIKKWRSPTLECTSELPKRPCEPLTANYICLLRPNLIRCSPGAKATRARFIQKLALKRCRNKVEVASQCVLSEKGKSTSNTHTHSLTWSKLSFLTGLKASPRAVISGGDA